MAVELLMDGGTEWVTVRQGSAVFKIGKIERTIHQQLMITAPNGEYRLARANDVPRPVLEWLVSTFQETSKVYS